MTIPPYVVYNACDRSVTQLLWLSAFLKIRLYTKPFPMMNAAKVVVKTQVAIPEV